MIPSTPPRLRVLVTNDDGVDSPGILALATALHHAGHEVYVVAPLSDLSGAGASIGPLHRSERIPVEERQWPDLPGVSVLAVDRPPATAVYLACLGAFGDPPDVIASGINPGANTGHLVLHSGTVGAALTGAGLGVSALAVSLRWDENGKYHWDTAATLAARALPWVLHEPGPRVLNLNVPNIAIDEIRGIRDAALAAYGESWVASADMNDGDVQLHFEGKTDTPEPNTDEALLLERYATVTPLLGIVAAPFEGAAATVELAWRHPDTANPASIA